jgi:hypothetical protein
MRYVVPSRTAWCDPFFEAMAPAAGEEILEKVAGIDVDAGSEDLARKAMSGPTYWMLFVRGYLEYASGGAVGHEDPYLHYLVTRFGPEGRDPGIVRDLADPEVAARRVALRYANCDLARTIAAGGPETVDAFDPVVVVTGDEPSPDRKLVVDADGGDGVWANAIDGYHRLFAARLFELDRVPCKVVAG